MTDPAGALERLAEAGGLSFPNLTRARKRTADALQLRRDELAKFERDDDVAVVLMGSWGRHELTSGSDDDFLVLIHGPERPEVTPSLDEVRQVLATKDRKPGREGYFNTIASSEPLYGTIGLEADTNRNMTRRVLLLLESVAAAGEQPWRAACDLVLAEYLRTAKRDRRPPRFLLNDVIRYWRTVAVDFEGKDRDRRGEGWGLRNAKLRTSRKMLFAAGLLPVLECYRYDIAQMDGFLRTQFAAPPTDRVADAFLRHHEIDAGVRALLAYDRFIEALDNKDFRTVLDELPREEAERTSEFALARALGRELQAGLLALLFDNRDLARLVREFMIF